MSNILLVEDDKILASTVADYLQMEGYAVQVARDGEEGLAMMRRQAPDLVVLDLIMPKKSGEEVLEEMRRSPTLRDIPVIVLTVKQDEKSMRDCLELGVQGYLIKSDYSLKEIEKNVRKVLKEK